MLLAVLSLLSLAVVAKVVEKTLPTVDFYDGIVNSKARSISHLAGALEKRVTTVEATNEGGTATEFYLVAVPATLVEQFAFIAGSTQSEELQVNEVLVRSGDSVWSEQAAGHSFFKIMFDSPLQPGDTQRLKITLGYMHVLKPLPAEIGQHDNQYSLYEGTRYFFSPYPTLRQSVRFNLASSKIKSHTKTGPTSIEEGSKIKYGPYNRVEPFEENACKIHFMNNEPILRASEVVRDYEISHWGNVRVQQQYNIGNSGAKLTGPFEAKSVYQRYMNKEPSAVRALRAVLPPNAHRVSYTDRIGNISSSHFRRGRKKSVLEIDMRYPLFGGWSTDFEIGYDAPASDFLMVDPSHPEQVMLNVSFASPFKTPVTDLMTVQVAMPEGAYDIEIQLPYEVDSITEEKRYTYLDSTIGGGRPLIVFTKRNVVNLHTRYFQVFYKYNNTTTLIRKPMLLFSTIFFLMAGGILVSHLNLSLTSDKQRVEWDLMGAEESRAEFAGQRGQSGDGSRSSQQTKNKPTSAPKGLKKRMKKRKGGQ